MRSVSVSRRLNDIWIFAVLGVIMAVMLYPFLNVISVSVTAYSDYLMSPMRVLPGKIDLTAYGYVMQHALMASSYRNTIFVTVVGTLVSMFLIVLTSYPLAHTSLKGSKMFMRILLFTMLFNGGLIPNFYLVRSLGLYNTLWALVLPGSLSAYYVVLMKNFLQALPASLEESARIDGAKEPTILFRIVLPLSMPIIATLALFCAVGRWNSFFNAIVYIKDNDKWTLQLLLREIVLTVRASVMDDPEALHGVALQNVKYAVIVVAVFPIMIVYPFLQRYFVKGVMLGAVKG